MKAKKLKPRNNDGDIYYIPDGFTCVWRWVKNKNIIEVSVREEKSWAKTPLEKKAFLKYEKYSREEVIKLYPHLF